MPDVWYGDYLAAVGAARIGERRVKELVERYGVETLRAFVTEWLDYSERGWTRRSRELPAPAPARRRSRTTRCRGCPRASTVNVDVEIEPEQGRGSRSTCATTSTASPFGLNLSEDCARGGAMIARASTAWPTDVPHNAGSFRRVEVLLREGSIVGGLVEPALGLDGDDERAQPAHQRGRRAPSASSATARAWPRAAGAMGVGFAVFSGTDPGTGEPLRQSSS